MLIGALLGLGTLARGSELTVMRAAGISVWRIAGSVAMAGVLLIVVRGGLRRVPRAAAAGHGEAAEGAQQVLHHHVRRAAAARGCATATCSST